MTTETTKTARVKEDFFYPLYAVLKGSCFRAGCWGCLLNNGWCRAINIRQTLKALHII